MSQRLEDYEVLSIIGRGTFGTCYKVKSKITNQLFVWKAVDYGKLSEDNKKNLVSEVNLLSKLDHPNIVKYFDRIIHVETTTLYIITEWCQGGDLAAVIKDSKNVNKSLSEEFIWRILYQVSKAIQVCHTKLVGFTVLHRDIKPANVFLDQEGNAKLGDFGLARIEQDEPTTTNFVGTPYYLSPEVVRGHGHNRKSDIWALGCLVYEMCSLRPPFNGTNMKELTFKIKSGKYKEIPSFYSENLRKVISFMLSVKHEFRPTIEMILHHPLVVVNIKSAPKPSKSSIDLENVCLKALQNLSMTTDAEEVTNNTFKGKWLSRLETLRKREERLKEKEEGMAIKERSLLNKEKQLALLERQAKEKLVLAEVYSKRRKDPRLYAMVHDGNVSDISADPGDTSVSRTVARIDPNQFPRPLFVRNTIETRSKRVHFEEKRKILGDNFIRPTSVTCSSHSPEDLTETSQPKIWLESKKVHNRSRILQDKENILVKPIKKPDKTFKITNFI
ncbi:serine/threonine-protein kinase Nek2-like [Cimex lectularius]|uniref:non-specific serine/threonine protein kinase n=1 Tax=Cimex lectularius TaxID=79782 RepID=A0A8I6RTG8_CIMLE|nr:serine/threonine-protein kinase Nek2-like [Cimex lectularius]